MSDSESDDDLLAVPTFRKSTRRESTKKAKQENLVKDALKSSSREFDHKNRIQESQARSAGIEEELKTIDVEQAKVEERKRDAQKAGFFDVPDTAAEEEYDQGLETKRAKMETDLRDERAIQLGRRRTISFDPKRATGLPFRFFSSEREVLDGLEKAIQKATPTKSRKAKWACTLRKSIKMRIAENVLKKTFLAERGAQCAAMVEWLHSVTASSLPTLHQLQKDAQETLVSLAMERGVTAFETFFNLGTFCNTLTCWVDTKASTKENGNDDSVHAFDQNEHGLALYLNLWSGVISTQSDTFVNLDSWARSMVLLLRIGIHQGGNLYYDCLGITQTIQDLIIGLVGLTKMVKDPSVWMNLLAETICQEQEQLGPDVSGIDDAGDTGAWMTFPTMCDMILASDQGHFSLLACQLQATVLIQALEKCVGGLSMKDLCVKHHTDKLPLKDLWKESLAMKALVSVLLSLQELDRQPSDDLARCLSVVHCSILAFEAGIALLKSEPVDKNCYGTSQTAQKVLDITVALTGFVNRICASANRQQVNFYYQRIHLYLEVFNVRRLKLVEELSVIFGRNDRGIMQSSIESFLKKPVTA